MCYRFNLISFNVRLRLSEQRLWRLFKVWLCCRTVGRCSEPTFISDYQVESKHWWTLKFRRVVSRGRSYRWCGVLITTRIWLIHLPTHTHVWEGLRRFSLGNSLKHCAIMPPCRVGRCYRGRFSANHHVDNIYFDYFDYFITYDKQIPTRCYHCVEIALLLPKSICALYINAQVDFFILILAF